MTDHDIVTRLRQGWLAHHDTDVRFVMVYASEWMRCTNLTLEAANEIERLRDERDHAVAALSEQIATLIRERDEAIKERNGARRTICRMESEKRYDQARRDLPGKKIIAVKPEMVAQEFGWFCFCKEEP